MNKNVIAVDLGGTNIRGAAVDPNGKILKRGRSKTPRNGNEIVDAVGTLVNELNSPNTSAGAVGMGLAAVVDVGQNRISNSPNLPELDGSDFAAELSIRSKLPVILENDATAAAIGEHWLGAGIGARDMICITLGTGVGGGIIANGEVVYGADGNAGEIGHICLDPDGPSCGCGSNGCLEQYASAIAIDRVLLEGMPEHPSSQLQGLTNITPKDVYDAGVAGDTFALEIYYAFGRSLGIAIAGLVNVLNPEVVVISGGVAAAWDLFIGETRDQVRKRAWKQPAERVKIVRGKLGDDAGILGAAKRAFSLNNKGS